MHLCTVLSSGAPDSRSPHVPPNRPTLRRRKTEIGPARGRRVYVKTEQRVITLIMVFPQVFGKVAHLLRGGLGTHHCCIMPNSSTLIVRNGRGCTVAYYSMIRGGTLRSSHRLVRFPICLVDLSHSMDCTSCFSGS